MSFQKIQINQFRAIDSLEIDNIKQVNVITGRNNCGKSSILEAIFLLTGMSNPGLLIQIHLFRSMRLEKDNDFSFLFRHFDFSVCPSISGTVINQERNLIIKPIFSNSNIKASLTAGQEASSGEVISNAINHIEGIKGVSLECNIDEQSFQSEIRIKEDKVKLIPNYSEEIVSRFFNSNETGIDIEHTLDAILVRKDLGLIINALQEIEPKIIDMRMGAKGVVYVDIGIDKLVPINLMGDGIRKMLGILAAIVEIKDSILLIDEIENGLHYRSLSTLWKAVLKAAKENNVQLFITTHSYECISALAQVYQEQNFDKEMISLFRIDKNKKGQHRAFQYDADTLVAGIEDGFEVR